MSGRVLTLDRTSHNGRGRRCSNTSMRGGPTEDQIDAALEVIVAAHDGGTILGVYLYGSAVDGGLRPDSDLDLFVVSARRLTQTEKRSLIQGLLPISGRGTRPPSWRPMEVTVVAQPDVRPWRYPPRWELQYGEWLREEFLAGELEPWPSLNPDLAVLISMVLASGRPLIGPPAAELLDPVPRDDLMRAMVDELPQLVGDLATDTRNVLLTLARIWTNLATTEILSKDAAADWALRRLPPEHRQALERARALYLDGGYGAWDDMEAVRAHAAFVVAQISGFVAPS
jgi:streptomycin 3"-adenylyltransferase